MELSKSPEDVNPKIENQKALERIVVFKTAKEGTHYINLWDSPSPGGGPWYGPSRVHQHTPAVSCWGVTLHRFVEPSLSTVWNKHRVILVLPCLLLRWLLLLVTWWGWKERYQSQITQKQAVSISIFGRGEWNVQSILTLFRAILNDNIKLMFLRTIRNVLRSCK